MSAFQDFDQGRVLARGAALYCSASKEAVAPAGELPVLGYCQWKHAIGASRALSALLPEAAC